MNPFSEAAWTMRLMARPALVWGAIAVFIATLIVSLGVAFFFFPYRDDISKAQNSPAKTVGTNAYVASFVGMFDCVASGPAECSDYDKAREAMGQVIPADGMKYVSADGSPSVFTWSEKGTSAQAKKVADAIGASGPLAPSDVTSSDSDTADRSGAYDTVVAGAKKRLKMNLSVGDQTVKIASIEVVK